MVGDFCLKSSHLISLEKTMENPSYYFLMIFPPLIFLIIFKYYMFHSYKNLPPSPPSLPILGHFHLIKTSLHTALASLASKYGPIFFLKLGCKSVVVVSSPSAIEECFTKHDVIFANRPRSMSGDHLTYDYKTFVWSCYGHYWRILRKLSVVELFSSQSIQRSASIREENLASILRVLYSGSKSDNWKRVDINYLSSTFSFNNIMRMLAGKLCVREDEISGEVGREIVKGIRGTFFTSLSLGVCDFFPVLRWIGYKGIEKSLMRIQKKRDEFVENLIQETKKANILLREKNNNVLIETLFSLQATEPGFYTHEVIKSLVLLMIIAGTETSAVTIESTMSLLLSNPDTLQILKQEIDDNVGHERMINDADLAKLHYLRSVANEALRLYPPVPVILPHYSSEECTVEGYKIPKNTIILVNAFGTHRDPNVWDKPEKFMPERFLDMDMEREGYKFVPFGVGRRACPGAGLGLRTIMLAVGAFVQCFEWEKVPEHEDLDMYWKEKARPLEALYAPRQQAIDILSKL